MRKRQIQLLQEIWKHTYWKYTRRYKLAGLRKPEQIPMGPCTLQRKLHLLLRHAPAELESMSGPPLFTAQMKTRSWHRACSWESPLWLSVSRRGLLENLYTPADVADGRCSPVFFKPIVRADSNLYIPLSVAFLVVLTVTNSSSMTRIRSWEQALSHSLHHLHA